MPAKKGATSKTATKKSAATKTAAKQTTAKKKAAFKRGDTVAWKSSQGTVRGTVERTLTSPTDIKGHHVAASKDNPEILVKSTKTGAEAAHKPAALRKT